MAIPVPATTEAFAIKLALVIEVTVALAVPNAASVMSTLKVLNGVAESEAFAVVGHVPVQV